MTLSAPPQVNTGRGDGSDGTMSGEEPAKDSLEGTDLADMTGLQCGDLDQAMAGIAGA